MDDPFLDSNLILYRVFLNIKKKKKCFPGSIPRDIYVHKIWEKKYDVRGKEGKGEKERKNQYGEELRQNLILKEEKDILSPNLYGTWGKKIIY